MEEAVLGPTHPRGPGAVVFAKVVEEGEGEGGVEEEVVGVVEEVVAVLPRINLAQVHSPSP